MGVIFSNSYIIPGGDEPLTHARIAHSGNWLSGGTITASGTATGYYADGPDNSLTYEKWKPDAIAATWEFDNGSNATCDYCCIGAHTLGTNSCTFTVQYYDGGWIDLIADTSPSDDMEIMAIFEPVTAQRWRISISAGTAPTIGVIKFGHAMQMQRALYGGHSPLDMSRQTTLRSNKSTTGEFLGRTKLRNMLSTSFQWSHLKADWMRTNWLPFQRAIEEEPFFIAWRPKDFSEVGLCYVDQIPAPSNMGVKDFMQVSMSVRARAYD